MAKQKAEKAEKSENGFVNSGGTVIEGEVKKGKDNKLSAKEQGQLARGETDENGDLVEGKQESITETLAKGDYPSRTRTQAPVDQTLYHGKITMSGIAAATGQKVSVAPTVVEPTTMDGLFYHFQQYHPSAIRDSFEIDLENKEDPTLRTYLE